MDRSFLLQTKFLVPRFGADRLPRPQLLARLEAAVAKRLTLISAPPGYGKTTLLAELTAVTRMPYAWYQLDAADGDPTIFLSYLIACFRRIQERGDPTGTVPVGVAAESLLEGEAAASAIPPERILTVLINEIAEPDVLGPDAWLLILEDYHLLTNPEVHHLVHILLEKGPPGLHLVISTRTDPPLALARMRAGGALADFRAPDLRFEQEEVRKWLTDKIPGVTDESARLLNEKTEGWPAALQIILSTLMGREAHIADRFIARLSGTQRFIFQYLAEEVFQQQPEARQRFLTYTAVLDQMKATICDAILDTSNAQQVLDGLEQDNLFLVGLDEDREWYRYHYLFREFLLGRLRREAPGKVVELERAAGAYYAGQGELEAAFSHYLRGEDHQAAAQVLAQFAGEYVERRRIAILQRYLGDLPEDIVRSHPELLLQYGNVLWGLGRVGAAAGRYEEARAAYERAGDKIGLCNVLTQMAELARSQGNYRRSLALAAEALGHISETEYACRANALMILAKSEGFLAGMDRGRELAEASVVAARKAGESISPGVRANLLRSLGHICWWHGDPQAALGYCKEALDSVVDNRSPIAAGIYITMATPYLYRRDLETAQKYAELGLDIAQQLQLPALLPRAYSTLGSLLTRRGKWKEAESYLRQAVQLSEGSGLDSYFRIMATGYLAQNLCVQGRIDEARQLAEGALWERAASPDTYEMVVCRSVLADVALEEGQLDEAETIFENLIEVGERRQFRLPLAMVYFGLAYVFLRKERTAEAIDYACRSVAILEPLGTWQLYLDQGERARLVCQALVESGHGTPFVSQILSRLPVDPGPTEGRADHLIEVRCLGSFHVSVDGKEVTQAQWVSTKARDLLAYFVTFRTRKVPIEQAINAIWPEGDGSDRAFHSALYRLRQALRMGHGEAKYVRVKGGECKLEEEQFKIDVDAFDRAVEAAKDAITPEEAADLYGQAIRRYRGEYLNNMPYYDWAVGERRRLSNQYQLSLRELAMYQAGRGNYLEAIALIDQLLEVDNLNEAYYRQAMVCHAGLGYRAGLVRQYQRLERTLQDELKVQPSGQTEELYRRLLRQVAG